MPTKLGKALADDILMFDGKTIRLRPKYKSAILERLNRHLFHMTKDVQIVEDIAGITFRSPSRDVDASYKIISNVTAPSATAPLQERTEYFKKFKDHAMIDVFWLPGSDMSQSEREGPKTIVKILNVVTGRDTSDLSNLLRTEKHPLSKLPANVVENIGSYLTGQTGPLAVQQSKISAEKGFPGVRTGRSRKTRNRRMRKTKKQRRRP